MNGNMKYLYTIQRIILLITCGLGFCVVGCSGDAIDPNEYIDVVVETFEDQETTPANDNVELKIRASLVNKTADEIELLFDSRQTLCAGGFRIRIGTEIYYPRIRATGSTKYDSYPVSHRIIPGHGHKEFDLLLELPKAQASHVLTAPETVQVFLIVYGIRHDSTYTDTYAEIIGKWKK